jgi:hypothetical protein
MDGIDARSLFMRGLLSRGAGSLVFGAPDAAFVRARICLGA